MFGDASLSFREFAMHESLPLATIQDAVLDFLRGRDDAVLFGAQAVNAYVRESRATEDVDIISPRAEALAEELRQFLADRFHISVRTREVNDRAGYGVYQVREPENRHLIDLYGVETLPAHREVEKVQVVVPDELIARKVVTHVRHAKSGKGSIDLADIRRLLLAYPQLKSEQGSVRQRLIELAASDAVLAAWSEIAASDIPEDDEDDV